MVELPVQRWQDLMGNLLNFAQDQSNVQLRVSTLVTLGFICEVMVSRFWWHSPIRDGKPDHL